jgi:hypothetical protein
LPPTIGGACPAGRVLLLPQPWSLRHVPRLLCPPCPSPRLFRIPYSNMSIFSFRTSVATAFVSIFYLAIFTSLYLTQYGPSLPTLQRQDTLGLSVEHAYRDLHLLSSQAISFPTFLIETVPFNRSQPALTLITPVKMKSFAISCLKDLRR